MTEPPDERSRPAGNGPAKESLDDDTPSVRATRQFFATLAEATSIDDPLFRAASLLADAWQPALARSYRLGYDNGYAAGFYEAEQDMAASWAAAAAPIRDTLKQPTMNELKQRWRPA